MPENIKIITEGLIFIGSGYKESTPLSNINETIIWEAELNTLTLGNNLSRTYNKSEPSSKKRKRDINTCEYNPSVFVTEKKYY